MIKLIAYLIIVLILLSGCQTKFVQMVEIKTGGGETSMAALDEEGQIWVYSEGVWREINTTQRAAQ